MEEEIGSINVHHHQGESNVSGNNINISSSNYEIINNNNDDAQYYYFYSLMEAMPLPGPTWSTTPPSLLLEEPPAASSTIEECCWLGFLEGLEDNGKMVISSDDGDHYLDLDHPLGLGVGDGVVDSNKVSSNELSSPFVDEFLELSYCPDDWLVGDTTIGE